MGDRTYVTLTVRLVDRDKTMKIATKDGWTPAEHDMFPENSMFIDIGFEDVNYGELPFLYKLEEAGIPYDSSWAKGDNYDEGTYYSRYTDDGQLLSVELNEEDYSIPIRTLVDLLPDYNELADYIRKQRDGIAIMSWINQERNSKLFLVNQLITE